MRPVSPWVYGSVETVDSRSVPNIYLLEGGVTHWTATFDQQESAIQATPAATGDDTLRYRFPAALGDRYDAAAPNPHAWEVEFTPKIKLELQRDKSGGGCG